MIPSVLADAAGAKKAAARIARDCDEEEPGTCVNCRSSYPFRLLGLLPIGISFLKPRARDYPILTSCVRIFRYRGTSPLIDGGRNGLATLARANTHPLRISVLEVLAMDGGRTLSPSELSLRVRVPLSNVNYHVTELVHPGLIELARERQVRGATSTSTGWPTTRTAQATRTAPAATATVPSGRGLSKPRLHADLEKLRTEARSLAARRGPRAPD